MRKKENENGNFKSSPSQAFPNLRIVFLPHTNTEILLDSYYAIIKETGLFSPGLPNYLESVRVNIGYPVVRTDSRSVGR